MVHGQLEGYRAAPEFSHRRLLQDWREEIQRRHQRGLTVRVTPDSYINQTPKLASDLVVPKSGRGYVQTSKDSSASKPDLERLYSDRVGATRFFALVLAGVANHTLI